MALYLNGPSLRGGRGGQGCDIRGSKVAVLEYLKNGSGRKKGNPSFVKSVPGTSAPGSAPAAQAEKKGLLSPNIAGCKGISRR